jgi:hypothetical protein
MNSKKETALKVIKRGKYFIFPFYVVGYLILLGNVLLNATWVEFSLLLVGFSVMVTLPFLMGVFGALLWTQYILEGYVKGTDKKIRCVISFSLSALGILFFIGWLLVAFDVWDIFAKPFYDSWLFWLIEGEGMYLIDTLVVLLYPILMIVESLLKKESQMKDQSADF